MNAQLFQTLRGQKNILNKYKPLMSQWLSGIISGNELIDVSGNNRNADIVDKDFSSSIGFPVKSLAKIKQKAENFGFIPNPNYFWFQSDGTPNEIPINLFFQNIDYTDQIYSRHYDGTIDSDGAEIKEPSVLDIVTFTDPLVFDNLNNINTFYNVPEEVINNVYWVSKDGNDTTGDGSKSNPYLTIVKAITAGTAGRTIYVKSGIYRESHVAGSQNYLNIYKYFIIKGIGNCEIVSDDTTRTVIFNSVNIDIEGFTINAESIKTSCISVTTSASLTYFLKRIYLKNANGAVINLTAQHASFSIEKCLFNQTATNSTTFYNLSVLNSYLKFIPICNTNVTITNSKLIDSLVTVLDCSSILIGNLINNSKTFFTSSTTVPSSSKTCYFLKNELHLHDITSTAYVIYLKSQYFKLEAYHNKFYYLDSGSVINAKAFINTEDIQNSICEYNYFESTVTSPFYHIRNYLTGSVVVENPYKINYNYSKSNSLTSSTYTIGEETTIPNLADNSEIIGNKIIGYKYNLPSSNGTIHQILANCGVNMTIKYNFISHSYYGIVIKAGANLQSYSANGVSYNIVTECTLGVQIKGVNGINVFGNTIYHSNYSYNNEFSSCFSAIDNFDGAIVGNLILKNNIACSKRVGIGLLYNLSTALASSFVTNTAIFGGQYLIDGYSTLESAQTAGYLDNSQLIDVQFIDILNNKFWPSESLEFGSDLGQDYNNGLNILTIFDALNINIIQKQQNLIWQIGAYIQ